jgi:hypothetical protein
MMIEKRAEFARRARRFKRRVGKKPALQPERKHAVLNVDAAKERLLFRVA